MCGARVAWFLGARSLLCPRCRAATVYLWALGMASHSLSTNLCIRGFSAVVSVVRMGDSVNFSRREGFFVDGLGYE